MKNINKTLCDFTKSDIDKYKKEIKKIVSNPKFMCKKCMRASSEKDLLCKPNKI